MQIEITHIRVERVDGQTHEWDVPETTMRDLLLGPWHGISTEDDQYKLLAGRDKNAANNLYMFDDGDVSPSFVQAEKRWLRKRSAQTQASKLSGRLSLGLRKPEW